MKKVTVSTFALIAILGTAACNKKTDQPTRTATSEGQTSTAAAGTTAAKQDRALVRFVNADPGHATADLWFGDMKAFSDVAYKAVTPYTELPADRSTFKLRASGQNMDVATNNEGLYAGRHYTLVAIHKKDGTTILRAVSDDLDAPAAGKAKVRMINAAPNAGELDLVQARDRKSEVFDAINFDSPTSFKEVDPGNLEVRHDDSKAPVLRLPQVTVQPDKFYTVIITGDQAVESIRIEDQLGQHTAAAR
jgi:hypothetical protein